MTASAAMGRSSSSSTWTQWPTPVLTPIGWEQQEVQEPSVDFDPKSHLFRMWYTGGNEGRCFVGYAESHDGVDWTRPLDSPVLGFGYGGVAGGVNACHSNVQRLAGRYYAWFSTEAKAYGHIDGNLYAATSPDGIVWTPLPKPALRAAKTGWNTNIANTYVIRNGKRWVMFWETFGNGGRWRMSTAESTDLVHWRPTGNGPVTGIGFGDTFGGPWVMRERGGWTMYFHAPPPQKPQGIDGPWYSQIYEARSADLEHWRTDPQPLVVREHPDWEVDQIADPSVVQADGKLYMYFSGVANGWPIRASIGVAILDPA